MYLSGVGALGPHHPEDMRESMRRPANVVVVGSVNADFVISVSRIPAEGETVGEGDFAQHWGGKGANQAAVAAQHGVGVTMIGAVGDDVLGTGAVAELTKYGVDVDRVDVISGTPTGAALVIVDHEGRNIVAVAPGANASIDPDGISTAVDAWSHVDAVLVCFEVADPVVVQAVRAGMKKSATVIVNPAPARPLPQELKGSGVVLTPNEHEVMNLAEAADSVTAAEKVASWTGGPVVVTVGEKGAVICRAGEPPVRVPAPKVVAKDTTGAGDAFNGTLAASLAEGAELETAVRRAVAAASLSVRGVGARGAIPSRQEVDDFIGRTDVEEVPAPARLLASD
jgi:ribokinase